MIGATTRRAVTTVITAALAAGVLAGPGTPVQAGGKYGPRLVEKYAVPRVRAGVPKWVKTFWTSRSDVCDVRVTVAGDDVADVVYPSNTLPYTSFSRDAGLEKGHVDYTAFRIRTTDDAAGWITLKLTVEYTNLPSATETPDPECTGHRSHRETTARLFVRN